MSESTPVTSVVNPQTPVAVVDTQVVFDGAMAVVPWYVQCSPEVKAALLAGYSTLNADCPLPMAEFAEDAAGSPTAVEYLASLGVEDDSVPAKAADCWAKFDAAVDDYAISASAKQLAVGKWAHAYIVAYVGNETDAGVRKARRAAAVKRCQDRITDACGKGEPVMVEKAIRLYAVAQTFGTKEAKRLGIGKLRAFEQALYREKDAEAWGFKDSVTVEQQAALTELWAKAVAGTVECSGAELDAEVRKALGKPVVEKPATKAAEATKAADKPAESTPEAAKVKGSEPAVVSKANTTIAERVPEVAPESPIECARRMASLPYGRPDSPMVWRNMGQHVSLSEADAAAFVAGLADTGKLQALTALAKAAIEAAKKLATAPKTAEAARAVASAA